MFPAGAPRHNRPTGQPGTPPGIRRITSFLIMAPVLCANRHYRGHQKTDYRLHVVVYNRLLTHVSLPSCSCYLRKGSNWIAIRLSPCIVATYCTLPWRRDKGTNRSGTNVPYKMGIRHMPYFQICLNKRICSAGIYSLKYVLRVVLSSESIAPASTPCVADAFHDTKSMQWNTSLNQKLVSF